MIDSEKNAGQYNIALKSYHGHPVTDNGQHAGQYTVRADTPKTTCCRLLQSCIIKCNDVIVPCTFSP